VPYHPNPYFTGSDLDKIRARLTAPEATSRRVVLTGLGGIGKTQLAVEHAYRQRADYDLVWWVRSDQRTTLLGDSAALSGQPPLATDLKLADEASQEALAAAVRGVVALVRAGARFENGNSSNDPTNQEVISKPRDQGGHETGRHVGQRTLPGRVRLLDGVGCMDGLRHAGWAGR
jgi:hypothetical protein